MSDLIRKNDALAMMDKYIDIAADDNQMHHSMCVVAEGIKEIPAVDAVPVEHGHVVWKDRRRGGVRKVTGRDEFGVEHTVKFMESYVERTPYCSVCGKVLGDMLTYCPNCGARMDGEENER